MSKYGRRAVGWSAFLGLTLYVLATGLVADAELISAEPDWISDGDIQGSEYGYAVAAIGDVNGDGYGDLAVGAPRHDVGTYRGGAVFVFHGSPSGFAEEPDWLVGGDQLGSRFGSAVAGAGDVNADGYDDLIVGAYRYYTDDPEVGLVSVFYGSADGLSVVPDWTATGTQANGRFGWAVAGAGDVNGDSIDDIVIGAPWTDDQDANVGLVALYFGSTDGLLPTPARSVAGLGSAAQLGFAVAGVGDVNDDGLDDVLVGAPFALVDGSVAGQATLYLGNVQTPLSAAWQLDGPQADSQFGYAVSGGGDVNGDGYADFLVGAPQFTDGQVGEGGAWLFCGGVNSAELCWHDDGDLAAARFGQDVAIPGDVNDDGFDDVLIGVPGYTRDQPQEGTALIYFGFQGGAYPWPSWHTDGNKADAGLGATVDGVRRANNDNFADLLVGAPDFRRGEIIVGRAVALFGLPVEPALTVFIPCIYR
ncbi:MAG: integrin alpha [Anaerolineae bacterium]|nr:integrin alpha [Anaerolineae bacterium]MCO5197266.1 integrin alpha [Anaerolineae bacterium]MCO5204796.1 integrin alpha [Anaerolineae bacterium]